MLKKSLYQVSTFTLILICYCDLFSQIVNIIDAYEDPRFNPDIDKKTGYKTKSILCMPIVSKNGVIGVVQMVNSLKGDHFTKEDENTFKIFAVYCALALHYSRIYNLLTHQQSKYKVNISNGRK